MSENMIVLMKYILLFSSLLMAVIFSSLTIKAKNQKNEKEAKKNKEISVTKEEFNTFTKETNENFERMIKEFRALNSDRKREHEKEIEDKLEQFGEILTDLNEKVNDHCESNISDFKSMYENVEEHNRSLKSQSRKVDQIELLFIRAIQDKANSKSKTKNQNTINVAYAEIAKMIGEVNDISRN